MEDIYVKMIAEERKKMGIPIKDLCEGICSEDLYYLLENDKCSVDRITMKRFLARLGVDNADYEHYLEYPDYEVWQKRMKIIKLIEDGMLEEAEKLLDEYFVYDGKVRNTSREGIELQFCIFMKLQIMRHRDTYEYEKNALKLYEQAVKQTVPRVDEKPLKKLVLSPLEFNLVLEYRHRKEKYKTKQEIIDKFSEYFEYIEASNYGHLCATKVYPKLVWCMYKKINEIESTEEDTREIYERLLSYNEEALTQLKKRKEIFYICELLEMRQDILGKLKGQAMSVSNIEKYTSMLSEASQYLRIIKSTYAEKELNPYMLDDCYLYRESGIYCIADVIRIRRKMMDMSREELCEGICSARTLMREENKQTTMVKGIFKEIFSKLKLNPDYINMGIVTDEKEMIETYEELRFAVNAFLYEDMEKLLSELKDNLLCDAKFNPINSQVLARIESFSLWSRGKRSTDEHIIYLKKALEQTLDMRYVMKQGKEKFFTTEELITLYLISLAYKKNGDRDNIHTYVEVLWSYIKNIEKTGLEDGRMGIYETVMTHIASVLGDEGRYEESNFISDKLVKMSLKLRRNVTIHHNLYNKIWNNRQVSEPKNDDTDELQRCIYISQLADDKHYEIFYRNKITV